MRKILLGYAKRKEIPFPVDGFLPGKYNGIDIAGYKDKAGKKIPTNFAHRNRGGSLAHYLTKYVTKNNENFKHLAWHNSRGFSALFLSIALSRESFTYNQLHTKLNSWKEFENDLIIFRPWYGTAPPAFWKELRRVNDFFQSLS